jgi:hypothetical protein
MLLECPVLLPASQQQFSDMHSLGRYQYEPVRWYTGPKDTFTITRTTEPTWARYGEMAILRHQGLVRDERGWSPWTIRTMGSVQLEEATRSERLARYAIKGCTVVDTNSQHCS